MNGKEIRLEKFQRLLKAALNIYNGLVYMRKDFSGIVSFCVALLQSYSVCSTDKTFLNEQLKGLFEKGCIF